MNRLAICFLFVGFLLSVCSCNRDEEESVGGLGFEEFVPQYNGYIKTWLGQQISKNEEELAEVRKKLAAEADEVKVTSLEATVTDLEKSVARNKYRKGLGDYFTFAAPEDLPEGLEWNDGMELPEIGDPACKKGGTFRYSITSFPPTLRPFGPKENNSFRSQLYDDMTVSLIASHPGTGAIMPGVAREWAFDPDGRTTYLKLHEDATYDDGVPIKARDYLIAVYLRASNNVVAPYWKQTFREDFAQWTVYDDHTLAVTTPEPKPPLAAMSNIEGLEPAAPHFYEEYGPDFETRYNWRVPPTTSAYFVRPEDVVKGQSVTLTRTKNWWARDKKFYRYRYNTDKIEWKVVRNAKKSWELFRAGEMDFALVSGPQGWYEESEIPHVFDGYIERYWWYNQFPRPPWGLYLNTHKPLLSDRGTRLGIAHAMNWQKVLDVIFWGDYARLPGFVAGYGDLVNPNVQAREFSVSKAREYFAAAGFTVKGKNGILEKEDGTRLEVTISYRNNSEVFGRIMTILKDEARGAGLEVILDGLDSQVNFKKTSEKKHEITCTAWSVQPPYFHFFEFFHSRNAYDEKGNLKINTNNVYSYANDEMDVLTENYRLATSREEKKELGLKIQQIVYDEGLYIPGWMRDFERVACWRWLRWPDTEHTKFCPKIVSYPYESYVFWIDEEMKEDTLKAMKEGRTFPEVERLVEDYRTVIQKGEEAP